MKNVFYILLILLSSCNSIPKLEVLQFNAVREIDGQEIILDGNVTFLTSMNDRIITFDDHAKTYFLSVYDDSTYKLITQTASYGKGENEFLAMHYMKYMSINSQNGDMSVLVLDYLRPKYYMINIDKSIVNKKCVMDTSIYNDRNNLILHNGMINDTLALCVSTKDGLFYLYNYIKQIPKDSIRVNEGITDEETRLILSSSCVYNINKKRFFIFYFNINRIISCDHNGENKKDYAVDKTLINYNNLICKNYDDDNGLSRLSLNEYYVYCVYNDDYVFVLCPDMSLNDYNNNPKPIFIEVFDWYSKPIMKLKIKEPLNTIALNKEKNILYGTTHSGKLYKYMLPKFDKNN